MLFGDIFGLFLYYYDSLLHPGHYSCIIGIESLPRSFENKNVSLKAAPHLVWCPYIHFSMAVCAEPQYASMIQMLARFIVKESKKTGLWHSRLCNVHTLICRKVCNPPCIFLHVAVQ